MFRRLYLGAYDLSVPPRPNDERNQAPSRASRAVRTLRIAARGFKDVDRRDVLPD